jgi:hypothetical protein
MGAQLTALLWWGDDGYWNGRNFTTRGRERAYLDLHEDIINEIGPLWLADGEGVLAWRREPGARLLYYRRPRDLAQSLCLLEGLEGEPDEIARTILSIADGDAVTRRLEERLPKEAARDRALFGAPLRRLSRAPHGGVRLEGFRYGVVGEDEEEGRGFGSARGALVDLLVEDGVARRPVGHPGHRG